jgi:NAD(P)H-dependent FMN reductase
LARNIVGKADAILFAVPEYNTTISSPLKNAYDWLSREDKNKFCPVTEKLAAMISSAAVTGGVKAQEHMRLSVSYRKLNVMTPSKDA